MKLHLTADGCYPYYYVREPSEYCYEPIVIDLSEEQWEEFTKVNLLHDFWQDRFEGLYKEARKKALLEATKGGVEPKGFD